MEPKLENSLTDFRITNRFTYSKLEEYFVLRNLNFHLNIYCLKENERGIIYQNLLRKSKYFGIQLS